MIEFTLNGERVKVDVPDDTPLLWVLREELGLRGTKYGCGKGICGSCTIHLNGKAWRSCILPVAMAKEAEVTTIEGLERDGLHPVQKAWIKHNVPQCGYCQSGQIMNAASLLQNAKRITEEDLIAGMNGVLCRCGTYNLIKRAIVDAARDMGKMK